MNLEKDKISKIEEVNEEDIDETLPSSEGEEEVGEPSTENETVELNSDAKPTEEQVANALPEGVCGDDCSREENEVETDMCENTECSEDVSSESVEPIETEEQKAVEKMLSQSQVNEIVGRTRTETRDSTLKSTWDRYGVSNEGEMDELVGRSQRYDMLHEDYDHVLNELNEAKIKLAMYDSGINPERYEDARLILQGKGKEITADNIIAEMETHPEWRKTFSKPEPEKEIDKVFKKENDMELPPVSKITRLGNDKPETQSGPSERDSAMSLYGF